MLTSPNKLQPATELKESTSCPVLESNHFLIRPFQYADLKAFTRYRENEVVARYQSWENYTYQDALALFNKMDYAHFGRIGDWYQLAIESKLTGEIVGDLAVHFVDAEKMEVGFTIAQEHQRKGIAFEALSRILDYLFLTLKKQKVVAFVDKRNKASYLLLEKAGFRRAADLQADSSPQAEWGDEYFYIKLKSMHN